MVKIAAWWPKIPNEAGACSLRVCSQEQSVLTAGSGWRIDAAPLRGILAADARRRSSLLANLHAARAACARTDRIERALGDLSRRTGQRLFDCCRTYAAHLAAHAVARGAREVLYDDRVRPDLTHFPWQLLRRRIAENLDERGIHFVHVAEAAGSPDVVDEHEGAHVA